VSALLLVIAVALKIVNYYAINVFHQRNFRISRMCRYRALAVTQVAEVFGACCWRHQVRSAASLTLGRSSRRSTAEVLLRPIGLRRALLP